MKPNYSLLLPAVGERSGVLIVVEASNHCLLPKALQYILLLSVVVKKYSYKVKKYVKISKVYYHGLNTNLKIYFNHIFGYYE